MRVLLASHSAALGGAERCLLDLAIGLNERGVETVVLCPSEGALTEALARLGIPVVVEPMRRPSRHIDQMIGLAASWSGSVSRVARAMRDRGVTVVYNNTVDALVAPFAAARLRIPCLWHVHEARPDPAWARRLLGRLIAATSTRAVFNSEATLAAFAGATGRPERWEVVYNGVELPDPAPSRSPGGPVVAGFAADLRPHKRPEWFLRALALAREQVPDLRGLVAGDGLLLEDARRAARALGLETQVTFLGRVADMAGFYASIDLIVSTSEREGLGMVLAEAMAAGRPVVATDVGGVPELVDDAVSGYLVPRDDLAACARAIVTLAGDPALRARMGAAGRRRVAESFSLARYRARMVELLQAAGARLP